MKQLTIKYVSQPSLKTLKKKKVTNCSILLAWHLRAAINSFENEVPV